MLNMHAAVLHVNSAAATATSPTMRIARFASSELKIPLVHNVETADKLLRGLGRKRRLDVLFVKYGMLKFSDHRDQCLEIYSRADQIINLENDYTFKPDPRFTRINPKYRVWSTVMASVKASGGYYVNWNMLTWRDPKVWSDPMPLPVVEYPKTLLYYGAFRANRLPSFERYLRAPVPYDLAISSYRGGKRFKNLNSDATILGAFRDPSAVGKYAATIYIEDEFSYENYTSPANRFYECLQEGVAQLFDAASITNMLTEGYDIDPYVVHDKRSLSKALKQHEFIRKAQRKHWYRDYANELRDQIKVAVMKSF